MIAGWLTLLLFPLLGWGVLRFFEDEPVALMLRCNLPIWVQLVAGASVGITMGYLARYIVTRAFMNNIENKYARVVAGLQLTPFSVIFLSFCAGFGEELFFRGAIQPLAGVWITAIAFVALHGYLSPTNWRLSIYGIFMVLAIALLGYMADEMGILAAAVAHMVIDIILFAHLREKGQNLVPVYSPFQRNTPQV